jgi:NTP pyrophosphatase (non-canonical NTP hydrolase)
LLEKAHCTKKNIIHFDEEVDMKTRAMYTLEEWIEDFAILYEAPDRMKSGLHIWMNVVDDSSALAEQVRRGLFKRASQIIPHIFCWYCCFIAKYTLVKRDDAQDETIDSLLDNSTSPDYNISRWVLNKYPHSCPACGEDVCACQSFRDEDETRSEGSSDDDILTIPRWYVRGKALKKHQWANLTEEQLHPTLEGLEKMFRKMYAGAHHDLSLAAVCFHLLEEVGEVGEKLLAIESMKKIKAGGVNVKERESVLIDLHEELKAELADVFSWISAVVDKLNVIFRSSFPHHQCSNNHIRNEADVFKYVGLAGLIEEVYIKDGKLICPACKLERCSEKCIVDNIIKNYYKKQNKNLAVNHIITKMRLHTLGDLVKWHPIRNEEHKVNKSDLKGTNGDALK